MLKNMISIRDTADGNCLICKKTFCCAKCRDRHANTVHPGLNGSCFLCAYQTLPMQQFESENLNSEDEQLLCHIIDKHLPLHCQLCGDTFESREDFKSFGVCKWWSRNCLTSPDSVDSEYLEKKLKRCFMSDSDYNDKFCTLSENHRKTSTPMLAGQNNKVEYDTSCIPDFVLKTPQANSSSAILQCNETAKTYESQNSATRDTEFFSFSTHVPSENTPFKDNKSDQFARSSSGRRKRNVERLNKIGDSMMIQDQPLSPINMELTSAEGGIPRDSPQLDPICEEPDETPEIVKKVRFSDEHKILNFEERMEFCVKSMLNTTMEEDDEEYHDARAHVSKNAKNANNVTGEHPPGEKVTANERDVNCNREEGKVFISETSLQNCLDDMHVAMIQGMKTEKNKENKTLDQANSVSTITTQQGTRVLMMVLVENNSVGLNGPDLMPLINSGLKKLQEQVATTNYSAPDTIETSGTGTVRRQSFTKMQMTVESYSVDDTTTAATTDYREIMQSSSSPARNEQNNERNGGFLSSFTQAVKHALKSFSKLNISPNSIDEVQEKQENEKKLTVERTPKMLNRSSSSNPFITNNIRSGKRRRDICTDIPSSRRDSFNFALENRSPLAKRRRRWYTMIKGRKPIDSMRNNRATLSRVSTGTQIFSQGSLTVGDTVLPLPTRAHQSTQTE